MAEQIKGTHVSLPAYSIDSVDFVAKCVSLSVFSNIIIIYLTLHFSYFPQ